MKNPMLYFEKRYQHHKDETIRLGHSVIESESDLLLLDYDNPSTELYEQRFTLLKSIFPHVSQKYLYPSRSGNGFHVVLQLGENLPLLGRIALQAAMGSDPIREMVAVIENKDGDAFLPFLIRPKMEVMIENIREKALKAKVKTIPGTTSTADTTNLIFNFTSVSNLNW